MPDELISLPHPLSVSLPPTVRFFEFFAPKTEKVHCRGVMGAKHKRKWILLTLFSDGNINFWLEERDQRHLKVISWGDDTELWNFPHTLSNRFLFSLFLFLENSRTLNKSKNFCKVPKIRTIAGLGMYLFIKLMKSGTNRYRLVYAKNSRLHKQLNQQRGGCLSEKHKVFIIILFHSSFWTVTHFSNPYYLAFCLIPAGWNFSVPPVPSHCQYSTTLQTVHSLLTRTLWTPSLCFFFGRLRDLFSLPYCLVLLSVLRIS